MPTVLEIVWESLSVALVDRGGTGDAHPLLVQFFSFSSSFQQNFYQIIGWHPNFWGWDPPSGKPWIRY